MDNTRKQIQIDHRDIILGFRNEALGGVEHKTREEEEKCAEAIVKTIIEFGRLTVLEDFNALLSVDAFVGFSEEQWKGVKMFFEMNNALRKANNN